MLNTDSALHLQPLPHKVPIPAFANVCVEFAMVENMLDALVFENLVRLFGIKKQWKDGKTTHLIVFAQENLEKSKKLSQIKEGNFKSPVDVIDSGWLFDSMNNGEPLPVDDYKIEY